MIEHLIRFMANQMYAQHFAGFVIDDDFSIAWFSHVRL